MPGTAPDPATERAMTRLIAHPLRVADLPGNRPTRFALAPDAAARAAIADFIGAEKLRKLRFEGELRPAGGGDWELEAMLGATVVQPCVVTLAPVTTRIDETVRRRYVREMPQPEGEEAEMPEDETLDPLGEVIDPAAVMVEALALALPPFPRADDAPPGEAAAAPPGAEPLRDEDLRPFAGLRDKLKGD